RSLRYCLTVSGNARRSMLRNARSSRRNGSAKYCASKAIPACPAPKMHRGVKQQSVHRGVPRRLEWKIDRLQWNARIDDPASAALYVAKAREQTKLAHPLVDWSVLTDYQPRYGSHDRQIKNDVIGQKAVMPAPALQGNAEIRGSERGAA